jgi:hypothetical protein
MTALLVVRRFFVQHQAVGGLNRLCVCKACGRYILSMIDKSRVSPFRQKLNSSRPQRFQLISQDTKLVRLDDYRGLHFTSCRGGSIEHTQTHDKATKTRLAIYAELGAILFEIVQYRGMGQPEHCCRKPRCSGILLARWHERKIIKYLPQFIECTKQFKCLFANRHLGLTRCLTRQFLSGINLSLNSEPSRYCSHQRHNARTKVSRKADPVRWISFFGCRKERPYPERQQEQPRRKACEEYARDDSCGLKLFHAASSVQLGSAS